MRKPFPILLGLLILSLVLISSGCASNGENPDDADYVIFTSQGCSHCAKVEAYIDENNLKEKFNIAIKEVRANPEYAAEFNQICTAKNIPFNERYVPMMYAFDECIVGDEAIIKYFEKRLATLETTESLRKSPEKPTEKPIE